MKNRPRVAILRGPLLNPFEMQTYEGLQNDFEITAITPHVHYFDLSTVDIPRQELWCPIQAKAPFERLERKWQVVRGEIFGDTFSYCGLRDRLKGFDLVHIADTHYCFSYEAALAKEKYGFKLVTTQWENIPHLNESKLMERQIKKTVLKQTDLFLAVSRTARKALLEEGIQDGRIRNQYPGIDTRHFSPGRREKELLRSLNIPIEAKIILYVGRLAAVKGLDTLFEAAKVMINQDPSLCFLWIGRDEEDWAKQIFRSGLENHIKLTGSIDYVQMPRYYRLADMLVLPSIPQKNWLEQFGMVLAEAMACGIPVVGSDCGAIPEVVGKVGTIFPAGNVIELVESIKETSRMDPRKASSHARKRSLEVFSVKVTSRQMRTVYEEVLNGEI